MSGAGPTSALPLDISKFFLAKLLLSSVGILVPPRIGKRRSCPGIDAVFTSSTVSAKVLFTEALEGAFSGSEIARSTAFSVAMARRTPANTFSKEAVFSAGAPMMLRKVFENDTTTYL
jgi:hypothetical protein